MSEINKMKDLQKFPSIFTFKIVGINDDTFSASCRKIFDLEDREVNIKSKPSKEDKYVSFSITTIILTYDELENFYTAISKLEGLKFYV